MQTKLSVAQLSSVLIIAEQKTTVPSIKSTWVLTNQTLPKLNAQTVNHSNSAKAVTATNFCYIG